MSILTWTDVDLWVPQARGRDEIWNAAIAQAEGLADAYCQRSLESGARDEYYDIGIGQTQLVLRNAPVTAISAISEDAQGTTPTTLLTADYVRDDSAGILTRVGAGWSSGVGAVRVQYTAGYTSATAPVGLKRALTQLVAWVIEMAGNVGVRYEGGDGLNVGYEEMDGPVPVSVGSMLKAYRRTVFG